MTLPSHWILFLLLGMAAGVFSGLFGIGGGAIVVPARVRIFKFYPHMATGTSVAVFLFPIGIIAAWEYFKRGHVQLAATIWIAIGIVMGGWAGAKLAHRMSGPALRLVFGIFLVLVGIILVTGSIKKLRSF